MKTSQLIDALSADAGTPPARPAPALLAGVAVAIVLAAIGFALLLGPRAGILASLAEPRFVMKFVVTSLIATTAGLAVMALGRPAASGGVARAFGAASVAALLLAVLTELAMTPSASWSARLFGQNWLFCIVMVPTISIGPLAILLLVMRRLAPAVPAGLGFAGGVLAGAIGATFYAAHCPDDSPLFVAVWYVTAIAIVGAVGAALGSRILRW